MSRFQQRLETVFKEVRGGAAAQGHGIQPSAGVPQEVGCQHGTAITMETLKKIADAHTTFPNGFTVHPKVMPQLQRRAAAITQGNRLGYCGDPGVWLLAHGGTHSPLTGQDTRRGTFVQRFASIVDRKTGEAWVP